MMVTEKKGDAVVKIENAFIEFLNEGKYPGLSVKELIERAGVGKSTFYRYYHDVYDVFDKLLEDFIDRVIRVMDVLVKNPQLYESVKIMFEGNNAVFGSLPFGGKDEALVRYSLESKDSVVVIRFMNVVTERFEKLCTDNGMDEVYAKVCARFVVGSVVTNCLGKYTMKHTIDLNDFKYAFQAVEYLVFKGGKNSD